ncbi:MAG: hypothetical protein K6F97_02940 [Lachnospiraceae bacterium]|nr:hypothetical protein [Lachnospiraceae bacterium]
MEYVSLDALDAIREVLQFVFNEVFVPVLKEVFNIIVYLIGDLLIELASGILLTGWVALLKLTNFMESIFSVFSGLTQVKVNDVSSNQGILQYLFSLDEVRRAMLLVTMVSFVLSFIATGISLVKSMGDSLMENKRPISTVMRDAFYTALSFFLIPLACIFLVQLTTEVLVQINSALALGNTNTTLGDTIFYTVAAAAAEDKTDLEKYKTGERFTDINRVQKDFDIGEIDYFLAYIVSLFLLLILLVTILQFIQRLLMLIILYIASPLFAAYRPLDEGKSFKSWRDSFVAYLISAFSPIIAMRLYMLMLPTLIGDDIVYPGGVDAMFLKLLVVIGGSFAIFTSRNMLVKLYNPSLGEQLDANSFIGTMVAGFIGGQIKSQMSNSIQNAKESNSNKSGGGGKKKE